MASITLPTLPTQPTDAIEQRTPNVIQIDQKTPNEAKDSERHPLPLKPTLSTFNTMEKILVTVHEMFADRNYTIVPRTEWSKKNTMEDLKAVALDEASNRVFVYFATDVKVPVKKVRDYIQHMEEHKVTHAIIVHAHQITSSAKSELLQRYDIEMFQARELFENITHHALVPKHEKIRSEQDIQTIMQTYHIKSKNDFPIYYTSDGIVRYYHWPPGTIVKIYRKLGGLRDPEIYYRHVKAH